MRANPTVKKIVWGVILVIAVVAVAVYGLVSFDGGTDEMPSVLQGSVADFDMEAKSLTVADTRLVQNEDRSRDRIVTEYTVNWTESTRFSMNREGGTKVRAGLVALLRSPSVVKVILGPTNKDTAKEVVFMGPFE